MFNMIAGLGNIVSGCPLYERILLVAIIAAIAAIFGYIKYKFNIINKKLDEINRKEH